MNARRHEALPPALAGGCLENPLPNSRLEPDFSFGGFSHVSRIGRKARLKPADQADLCSSPTG